MSILSDSTGEFIVRVDGEEQSYTDYNDVPQEVEAVIKFLPNVPEDPHTLQQHEEISKWNEEMLGLVERAGQPPATRIGDADVPHCSGMVRAEGSPNVFVNQIPWSRQGDNNTPHLLPPFPCPAHAAPIAIGSPTVFVNQVGAGRVGDAISGCTSVAAGSPNVFCGP